MEMHEHLYALRKKYGLSQDELAERVGCSRTLIAKWESPRSGTRERETLIRLCRALGEHPAETLSLGNYATGEETDPFAEKLTTLLQRIPHERRRVVQQMILDVATGAVNLAVNFPSQNDINGNNVLLFPHFLN